MASGGLQDGAHDYGRTDAGTVRERARPRVRRGVHDRVLATRSGRMETLQKMGRQTSKLPLLLPTKSFRI